MHYNTTVVIDSYMAQGIRAVVPTEDWLQSHNMILRGVLGEGVGMNQSRKGDFIS
jgi:hypothetical protein